MSSLGFGQVNFSTGGVAPSSTYLQSLYSSSTPVVFTPSFRGLGLPAGAWNTFANSMEILTKGSFDCTTTSVDGSSMGYCLAYTGCGGFTNVWSYAFQANFAGNTNYINVPLSTFAFDYIDESSGAEYCQIFVEYLDPTKPQSNNVIFGAMFFQSFLGVFTINQKVSPVTTSL